MYGLAFHTLSFFSSLNSPITPLKPGKYTAWIYVDIGYVRKNREEMEVLFTLSADRYEKASTTITSNLTFSEWEKILKDPMATAAAIDRLVRHSLIKELNLDSYILKGAKLFGFYSDDLLSLIPKTCFFFRITKALSILSGQQLFSNSPKFLLTNKLFFL